MRFDTLTGEHSDLLDRILDYLVAEVIPDRANLKAVRPAAFGAKKILAVRMHVTNACNLRCSYCCLHKTAEDMQWETGRRSVDVIFDTAKRYGFPAVKLKFSGGEATLNLPLVLQLQDYARQLANSSGIELDAVILSNGVAISRRVARALKEHGLRVMISLDGVGEYHDAQRVFANGRGSFYLVNRAIDFLLEAGVSPDISVTISERNLGGLPQLINYILDHDLPFSLNLYRENDCSASFADLQISEQHIIDVLLRLFQQIEERLPARSLVGSLTDKVHFIAPHDKACAVGANYMVIDQHGNVAKCQMEIERPITTIYAADPLGAVREDLTGVQNVSVEEKQGCRDCTWRYWCAGGCPVHTFRATGRYDINSPHCNIYKALFPSVLRLEALRVLKYGVYSVEQDLRVASSQE